MIKKCDVCKENEVDSEVRDVCEECMGKVLKEGNKK